MLRNINKYSCTRLKAIDLIYGHICILNLEFSNKKIYFDDDRWWYAIVLIMGTEELYVYDYKYEFAVRYIYDRDVWGYCFCLVSNHHVLRCFAIVYILLCVVFIMLSIIFINCIPSCCYEYAGWLLAGMQRKKNYTCYEKHILYVLRIMHYRVILYIIVLLFVVPGKTIANYTSIVKSRTITA